jgi:hypothetical protein
MTKRVGLKTSFRRAKWLFSGGCEPANLLLDCSLMRSPSILLNYQFRGFQAICKISAATHMTPGTVLHLNDVPIFPATTVSYPPPPCSPKTFHTHSQHCYTH